MRVSLVSDPRPGARERSGQVPIGPVIAKAIIMLLGILGGYLLLRSSFDMLYQEVGRRVAGRLGATLTEVPPSTIIVDGIWLPIEPYALTALLTIIGVNIFIFRSRPFIAVVATIVGVAIIVIGYLVQVLLAVTLATKGIESAHLLTSGLIAFILVIGTFIAAFVVQLQIAIKWLSTLANRPA